ncbi:MauE/DoxX family redox-associated membrane protein [Gracilibacillus saliphilus]|uniref:MauE/DoxX family redox-associated membrane protein n=1 Tax=Gracilibacillus saliphilus TaxID=543890 RepID=UPI0013D4E40A|nr:MauE/DoxX family redox-associated membrane protein [Gracilibacillus saliphilus]
MSWIAVGHAFVVIYFLFSSLAKLVHYPYFVGQLPKTLVRPYSHLIALMILITELTLTIALIFHFYTHIMLAGLVMLVSIFTVYLIIMIQKGITKEDCGCYGGFLKERLDYQKVIKNILLITFLIVLLLQASAAVQLRDYGVATVGFVTYLFVHHLYQKLQQNQVKLAKIKSM